MSKLYCRIYQKVMYIGMFLMPWRQPKIIEGINSMQELCKIFKDKNIKKVLVVTDNMLFERGLLDNMFNTFKQNEIDFTVYNKTIPNPTIDNIEEAKDLYIKEKCHAIVAFGGGSPIDCAKIVGARIVKPRKTVQKMRGLLKIRKKLPLLIAVPTTSGTGSETTVAAVITDAKTHEKYPINDFSLIPHYAVLDPSLTVSLPKHITSTTGIDALTHAVEAFIGKSNTKQTKKDALKATKLIFENLLLAYNEPENLQARQKMQEAAYLAGAAFTRAYVGNIHAIAHSLGGFYSTPHGLANAVILPYVLEYYGKTVYKKLAKMARYINLCTENESDETASKKFIKAIKDLNNQLNIPTKIEEIKDEDIPAMIKNAKKEANPLYPVPMIFKDKDFENIYNLIKA